mgnify:FL=1
MGNSFETITVLQYRLKAAQEELAAFQSGEKYIRMEKQHLTQVRALERRIAKLEAAVAKEHSHAITIRNQWFEIFEQLQKECDRMVAEALKKAAVMEKRALRAEKQRDTALEKVTSQRRELYKVKTELDDEKQKVQKLTAQINRNYENSSIPSSKSIARKKISNAAKRQEGNPVDSQDTGVTAERNSPRQGKSIFLHPKKYSMTLTLRKHRKPLQSRKSTSA